MPRKHIDSNRLTDLQRRLDGWRRRHGGRGRRIPDDLWQEAAEIAQREGVSVVARVLRLRRERLGRLMAEMERDGPAGEALEFVEIQLPVEASVATTPVFVLFEAPDGRRLQLEVPSAAGCDVGAIFAAFAGQPR